MNFFKKIGSVLVVTLALNCVALLVAAAMLAQKAGLDGEKIAEVRGVLFPEPEPEEPADSAEEPAEPTAAEQLDALLADASGVEPAEVGDASAKLDARAADLERALREVADRRRQVEAATRELAGERTAFEAERAAWRRRVERAADAAGDAGFAESLAVYESLPARQVKALFDGLGDAAVLAYLRAMEPRLSAKVLKEMRTPDEQERARRILELMRAGDPAAAAAANEKGDA